VARVSPPSQRDLRSVKWQLIGTSRAALRRDPLTDTEFPVQRAYTPLPHLMLATRRKSDGELTRHRHHLYVKDKADLI